MAWKRATLTRVRMERCDAMHCSPHPTAVREPGEKSEQLVAGVADNWEMRKSELVVYYTVCLSHSMSRYLCNAVPVRSVPHNLANIEHRIIPPTTD